MAQASAVSRSSARPCATNANSLRYPCEMLRFVDVAYRVNGNQILRGVTFELAQGKTLVLLGRSGSGKTTALKMVNALILPTSGEVIVENRATTQWNPIELRRRIGYVIQETGLFPHFTVEQNVSVVPRPSQLAAAADQSASRRTADARRPAPERIRVPLSARAFRRPAPARRRCPSPGRRPAHSPVRRAVRLSRSRHPSRSPPGIPRARPRSGQDHLVRHPRHPRSPR